jgi:hypothetical protein
MTKKKRIKLNKDKRSNVFRLRLTELEREQWEAMAEEVGLGNNLSKFVRHCVERRSLPAPIPEINQQTYWELGKIGVNFNQITHAYQPSCEGRLRCRCRSTKRNSGR